MTPKFVLISGSLCQESYNSAALRAVGRIIEERSQPSEAVVLPIGRLPYYIWEVEAAGTPTEVLAARAVVAEADVVIIGTPSYKGATPGVLNTALDWLSRPHGESVLAGKPVAVLSASPGRLSVLDARSALLPVLDTAGAMVVGHSTFTVTCVEERLDPAGELTGAEVLSALRGLVETAALAACVRP
ncbi:NADPH-dependent FMN reductase [Kitasatospora sp. NPDC002227]|uniref:NADPH-dependent FMN reductase n=1 Tax=Kitasatospora sp. NPDC002227 TaxID=3154773 RepID=UPI00332ABEE2